MTIIGQLLSGEDESTAPKTPEEIAADKKAADKLKADKQKRKDLQRQERDRQTKQIATDAAKQAVADEAAKQKGRQNAQATPPKTKKDDSDGDGVSGNDDD